MHYPFGHVIHQRLGSGFITRFHIRSLLGVRDADVRDCWSTKARHAESAAELARELDVGRRARSLTSPARNRSRRSRGEAHVGSPRRRASVAGGVLNDMACHSIDVVRHLLTAPAAHRDSIRPRRAPAGSPPWSRPERSEHLRRTMGKRSTTRGARAAVTIEYEADNATPLIGEATTSWSYVGPGPRLSMEFLGPSTPWPSIRSRAA